MPTADPPAGLLLDTHVWCSMAMGEKAIRASKAAPAIEHASQAGRLFVSAISVWELCMLDDKGRICMAMDRLEWVRIALLIPGLSLAPLTPEVSVESTRLPGTDLLHADPADRIIAATARVLGLAVVTRDRGLLDYAAKGFLRAIRV